jgi:hypothetical protein
MGGTCGKNVRRKDSEESVLRVSQKEKLQLETKERDG